MNGRPWPPRRFEPRWTLSRLMILIAGCALGLGVFRLTGVQLFFLVIGLGVILGPFFLARRGFRLVDIATVLVIVLLALALLLPAMLQTRYRTAGRRTWPFPLPPNPYSTIQRTR